MTDAIACTMLSYKTVPTRKVFQIVVEMPIEHAGKAIALFGAPDPDGATWLAMARLNPGSSNGRTPDFESGNGGSSPSSGTKREYTQSQRAALMLKDKEFQDWLVNIYWTGKEEIGDYDGLLKRALGITSKTELDTPGKAAEAWDQMLTSFKYRHSAR